MGIMRSKVSFDTVRKLGLQLPHVEEGTAYGKPALKIHGKGFACMSSHESAEPDSLVSPRGFRSARGTARRGSEYLLHYGSLRGLSGGAGPAESIDPAVLKDLLGMAYRMVSREATRKKARER